MNAIEAAWQAFHDASVRAHERLDEARARAKALPVREGDALIRQSIEDTRTELLATRTAWVRAKRDAGDTECV